MKKTVKLKMYEPAQIQKNAHRIAYEEEPFITLLAWGRQSGKSIYMKNDCFMYALNHPKSTVLFLSPIQDQSNKVMNELDAVFEEYRSTWELIIKKFDRKWNTFYFQNGSVLRFKSADSGDNLRGGTYDRVYLDEAAYMDLDFIQQVVFPFVTRTGGRLVMASTFKGKNWYWDWYNEGLDEGNWDRIKSMKATYRDLVEFPEVIDHVENNIRPNMSKASFAQEYLCEPVDGGTLFTDIEGCIREVTSEDVEGKRLFIGMDIGISQDYTVLTCVTEDNVIVDIDRFHYKDSNMTNDEFRKRIIDFVHKHYEWLHTGYFELNNNQFLYDELCDMDDKFMMKMLPMQVTPTSKPDMVNNLILLFDHGRIVIPNNEELKAEVKELVKELYDFKGRKDLTTGNIRFAGDKNRHDDSVMSLSHATWCCFEELDGGFIEFHR